MHRELLGVTTVYKDDLDKEIGRITKNEIIIAIVPLEFTLDKGLIIASKFNIYWFKRLKVDRE